MRTQTAKNIIIIYKMADNGMLYIPQEVDALIKSGALFVINDSAGKDSQAMKRKLIKAIPKHQLVIVHANLPEVEWDGNLEHIKKYADGVPVFEVQANKTFFQMVEHRKKFPSPTTRQCTSDLKRNPIQKFINNYTKENNFYQVVNCLGIRAQESPGRAKQIPFQYMAGNSSKKRLQFQWLPIHEFTIEQVWNTISLAGQEPHWAYKEGMKRLSCCFCIMACQSDLKTAARLKPQLAAKYIEMEERLNFTMFMSRTPLKELIK